MFCERGVECSAAWMSGFISSFGYCEYSDVVLCAAFANPRLEYGLAPPDLPGCARGIGGGGRESLAGGGGEKYLAEVRTCAVGGGVEGRKAQGRQT